MSVPGAEGKQRWAAGTQLVPPAGPALHAAPGLFLFLRTLQDGHFWLCSAGDSPKTPRSPPRCPRLGPLAASSLQQHHCSKDVRGSSPPPPAPLRTKAALSLPCLLARYNRALLSGSKSPFQSPSLLQPPSLPQLPPPRFPSQPCRGDCSQPATCLSPSRFFGDPGDLIPFFGRIQRTWPRGLGSPAAACSKERRGGSSPATGNYRRGCCHMIRGRQQSVSLLMPRCMCRGWRGCQGERLEHRGSALSQPTRPPFSESPVPQFPHRSSLHSLPEESCTLLAFFWGMF